MDFIKEVFASIDLRNFMRQKNFFERFAFLVWGTLLYSVAYTLCFYSNNIVIGGTSGIAQVISNFVDIDVVLLVAIFSAIIQIFGFIFLGFEEGMNTLLGVILFPIFLKFSEAFLNYIDLGNVSLLLLLLIASNNYSNS